MPLRSDQNIFVFDFVNYVIRKINTVRTFKFRFDNLTIDPSGLTAARELDAPDASGTIALTSGTPTISSGTAAPTSTPGKVGDIYVDTVAHKLYFADGTTNSSNWVIAN